MTTSVTIRLSGAAEEGNNLCRPGRSTRLRGEFSSKKGGGLIDRKAAPPKAAPMTIIPGGRSLAFVEETTGPICKQKIGWPTPAPAGRCARRTRGFSARRLGRARERAGVVARRGPTMETRSLDRQAGACGPLLEGPRSRMSPDRHLPLSVGKLYRPAWADPPPRGLAIRAVAAACPGRQDRPAGGNPRTAGRGGHGKATGPRQPWRRPKLRESRRTGSPVGQSPFPPHITKGPAPRETRPRSIAATANPAPHGGRPAWPLVQVETRVSAICAPRPVAAPFKG